jgi:NAD(P)-dependent dehydrogenase (short-subunit alcohol dehydrogenase family)
MCFFKADVTDEETCNRIFEKIAVDYGRLDTVQVLTIWKVSLR